MQENEKPQNVAFYWSSAFARTLFEEGVRHVILSPGSRSTALMMAFVSHPGFTLHTIMDERSAAFTAVGIGRSTGTPALLICTSGTAVANYFPAVIEATQSGVPLMLATADRPYHLQKIGASQTIDQVKIFGDYPAFQLGLGEPSSDEYALKHLITVSRKAFRTAITKKGVAHLNFPFRKPFEPEESFLSRSEFSNHKHSRRTTAPTYTREDNPVTFNETFWSDIVAAEYPMIVVGPDHNAHVQENVKNLAKILNAPVLAEPGSNIAHTKYSVTGFDGFLKLPKNSKLFNPDLILRFGQQPVSKALNEFLEKNECKQLVFSDSDQWFDGSLSATKFIELNGVIEIPDITGATDKNWLKDWKKAEKSYKKFREDLLHPSTPIADGYVFSKITELIPKNAFTFLSNSFPVRDMSMFGNFSGREIYTNRGAAGIDGIVSSAIGTSIGKNKTGVLFIGDIAFLHDSNGLLNNDLVQNPLVIVILNNGGGTIFRMLPANNYKKRFRSYLETPQRVSISALCRAHKITHTLVSRPEQITPAFETAISKNGIQVIECMTDADISMQVRQDLWKHELDMS